MLDTPPRAGGGGMGDPPREGGGGMDPPGATRGGLILPGEIDNQAPPTMACPICSRNNFKTQTELEMHSAQCQI